MAKLKRSDPWITQLAREFLSGFVRPEMSVLEFGVGGSTVWLSKRCKLTTVEHDAEWMKEVLPHINSPHWSPFLRDRPYSKVCSELENGTFDLVLVDGRDRVACAKAAIPLIRSGGILMLDNAERRHYGEIDRVFCKGWNAAMGVQRRPDEYGFTYERWTTAWWQKP